MSSAPGESFRGRLRAAGPEEAPLLVLGGILSHGPVDLRVVEVEAYGGPADSPHPDPAAHTWPGPTARNAVMFGDAGHLYTYLSMGIHHCANISYAPAGQGGGVLLRAARIEAGHDDVASRRPGVTERGLARGPGNLGRSAGITLAHGGTDLLSSGSPIRFRPDPDVRRPRTAGRCVRGGRRGVALVDPRRARGVGVQAESARTPPRGGRPGR